MNNTIKIGLLAGLMLGLNLAATPASQQPVVSQSKPNILLILSDDHARQALSCYGNTDIQTPGFDRLAAEGMRFEHALTPNSFCTPSRAAVLMRGASPKQRIYSCAKNYILTEFTINT